MHRCHLTVIHGGGLGGILIIIFVRATRLGWEPGPGSLVHARAFTQPSFGQRPHLRYFANQPLIDYATVTTRSSRAGQPAGACCGSWSRRRTATSVGLLFYLPSHHYYLHLALLVLCSPPPRVTAWPRHKDL